MRRLLFLGILILITSSCATEKLNLSPLSNTFSSDSKSADSENSKSISINITENVNASEITNLISTFPKFSNTAVNDEVSTLKYTLQNYLYAVAAGNNSGKNKTIKNLEKSYKNIQKLRKYLKKDEDEVLNRYLVRLKTNITVIEDSVNGKK
ncbi:hypothetical protein NAL32_01095 [Chryseobacterium sp. Ch-15]|uniref:Uncharacterized protein n=1 Tax=Chryseobacterium muglaense TaxID=2893752 RepID=A0A9Q3YR82_9FLAO|nr:hypothetical protein [Chryseobacterium muglaense]MBD3903645.1 hypothetical protein [Chryseobacterium muglaense]MCC9034716.1 hypothetical protein [Chryseobacterium muglaense]MCM2552979.1 hypothetical protein [Chryseobacterium muglaense]